MCGIAICSVHMEKPPKWKSEAQIVQLKMLHNKLVGRTKDNHEGVARRAEKSRGKNKYNDESKARTSEKLMGRPNPRKGLTKENCECFAKISKWRTGKTKYNNEGIAKISEAKKGKNKYNTPGIARMAEWRKGKSFPNGAEKRKGRTKENDESVARMAQKLTGRTAETHPYIAKIAESRRGRTKENDPSVARMAEKKAGRTKETHEYLKRAGEKIKLYCGEKASNWKGGISFEPYAIGFNAALKRYIRDRDGHICQGCGIREDNFWRKLDIHHINYDKINISENNLISVCSKCNFKANYSREFWQRFYTDKVLMKSNGITIYG